ncbi:hypothetical protein VM1G_09388 [Cytospora mali]|uniref:Uncharacterized protein n=1 Tax=Cytospora mali TaxID=578113 RepID=A0A194WBW1_CYTMA|nr:hypothetical protein VM1G_09388 [Valsa mali]
MLHEEKKRYFKIEAGGTAPNKAAWSAENVKKRKAKQQLAVQEQKRLEKTKNLIKRSSVLAHPQVGGRLLREFGVVDPELPVASWAAGLREKGGICFLPGQEWMEDARNISCMLIDGEDEASGLGAVYATPDGQHVVGSYIPTDKDDKINFAETDQMRASRLANLREEDIHMHEITSMTHHKRSGIILLTSMDPDGASGSTDAEITFFRPRLSMLSAPNPATAGFYRREFGGRKPAWLLGSGPGQMYFSMSVRGLAINAARMCPASGAFNIVLATNHGVMRMGPMDSLSDVKWVTTPPASAGAPSRRGGEKNRKGRARARAEAEAEAEAASPRDVYGVDFQPSSEHVIYAGCRDSKIHRIDMRVPYWEADWDWYRHHSAVAHVRSLDHNQILAAGPKSSMAIYDVRWGKKGKEAMPVVRFPEYRNAAHLQIGLDVTHDVGGVGGLGCGGVVAAAMDDGTVGIFSLRSGRKLKAGDVDNPEKLKAANGVVKTLQFEKMPWEKETSLFVGVGPVVKKFSFGVDDDDEEW